MFNTLDLFNSIPKVIDEAALRETTLTGGYIYLQSIIDGTGFYYGSRNTAAIADSTIIISNNGIAWKKQSLYLISQNTKFTPPNSVAGIAGLLALNPSNPWNVLSYHGDSGSGGGIFYWNSLEPKSSHNGGTIIDPDAIFPADWTNQTELTTWFTATTASTTGCWIRQVEDINANMFGAKGDNSTDDTISLQNLFNVSYLTSKTANLPEGLYIISSTLSINNINIKGSGTASTQIINSNSAFTATTPLLDFVGNLSGCEIRDFYIKQNLGDNTLSVGIQCEIAITNFIIDNIKIATVNTAINIIKGGNTGIISRMFISDIGGNGMQVDAGGFNVTDCFIGGCAATAFAFTSVTGPSAGLIIKGCTAVGYGGSGTGLITLKGNSTYGITDAIISNCVLSGNAQTTAMVIDTFGERINISNIYEEGAGVDNISGAIIVTTAAGISLTSENLDVKLSNSGFYANTGYGIQVGAKHCTISNCSVRRNNIGNTAGGGQISIASAQNFIMSNCLVDNSSTYPYNYQGVTITTSTNFILKNNIIQANTTPLVITGGYGVASSNIGAEDTDKIVFTDATNYNTTSTTAVSSGTGIIYIPAKSGRIKMTLTVEGSTDTGGDGVEIGIGATAATALVANGTAMAIAGTGNLRNTNLPNTNAWNMSGTCYLSGLSVGASYAIQPTILAITGGTAYAVFTSIILEEM